MTAVRESEAAMTYTTEPCGGGGEWYFVTDGLWIEGGDMSESTAKAVAERLNDQAAEIERLRADYSKLHGVVETYIDAPAQIRGEAFRDMAGTMEHLAGRDDALGWAACWKKQKDEADCLRDAVAYLRASVTPPAPDHPAWCWPDIWQEFERRVSSGRQVNPCSSRYETGANFQSGDRNA
jgi:hypothetical protein